MRQKRQLPNAYNTKKINEVPHVGRHPQNPLATEKAKEKIDSTMNTIQLSNSKGNPSFSINASTVYILYPSIFQDPNIFGRLSIPQNINADEDNLKPSKENIKSPQMTTESKSRRFNPQQPMIKHKGYRKRRNVPAMPPQNKGNENSNTERTTNFHEEGDRKKKENVETNLTGTIVVLNQDVIEQNTKHSY